MKIYTLIENRENGSFHFEHGLSLLIEIDGKKILFDTGQTGVFIENAKKLNVRLDNVDYVVLSHGHYDHVGGFRKFIDEYDYKKEAYVGLGFSVPKYKKVENEYVYNGITFDAKIYPFKETSGIKLTNRIEIINGAKTTNDFEAIQSRFYLKKEEFVPDLFLDELFLTIDTPKGLIVILACSHVGVVNIISHIIAKTNKKIRGIIGGMHLIKANEDRVSKTISYLKSLDLEFIAPIHCTENSELFRNEFGKAYINNPSGNILKIDEENPFKKLAVKANKTDYKRKMYEEQTDKNYKDGDRN